ncbi:MAG: efflux RND transporter periplasmic adaptor subunit [bacterium]
MRRKKLLLAVALITVPVIFVGVPLTRIMLNAFEEEDEITGVPVRLGTPQRRTLRETVRYSGTLVADRTASVIARQSGEVISIPVSTNDTVEDGDVVAELEDDTARLELEQAEANLEMRESQLRAARRGARDEEVENARADLEQAEEELGTAENDLERTRRLHEAGTIPKSELEAAENAFQRAQTEVENGRRTLTMLEEGATEEDLEQAESAVRAAERQVDLAELQHSYTTVKSPVSGRIIRIEVEEGATVDRGTPIAHVVNDDLIRAQIPVPEGRYGDFNSHDLLPEVRIDPAAYPGIDQSVGTISRVGSSIDPDSRTFEVEVSIENRDGPLRPGMFVEARFTLREQEDAFVVPDSAVVNRAGKFLVFAVDREDDAAREDGAARTREIEVERGLRSDGYTEIRGDIGEDTEIVVEGNSFLEDSQSVRIVENR